jgi:Phosphoenolpyruvate synthase/pyruvate phosphate dikinase
MIVSFPGVLAASVDKVGGKAHSLIRMTQIGLPVPPGIVLTVEFFEPWMNELKLAPEWTAFMTPAPGKLKDACDALKVRAQLLQFTDVQQRELDSALAPFDKTPMFAVRSSSPEEDLEGTSFAGGYETILGVTRATIHDAIRKSFASSLDFRIVAYKLQHGFDVRNPKIAVVIQEQIDSTVAGVAFSINPLTNDYDEAVFNSNWGLGESVVSGAVTPDTIVVNKVNMQVKEKQLGSKRVKHVLKSDGGTRLEELDEATEFSISDGHVLSLTRHIKTLEDVYQMPVDVEWALAGDREYILQARPVTSYVPLPPEMLTAPGAKRKLYLDVTLSVQAIEKPMSVMGTSILKKIFGLFTNRMFGVNLAGEKEKSMVLPTAGRLYVVFSYYMQIIGRERAAKALSNVDTISSRAIAELKDNNYVSREPWVSTLPFKLVPGFLHYLPGALHARMFPEKTHLELQRRMQDFKQDVRKIGKSNKSLQAVIVNVFERLAKLIIGHTMPAFLGSRYALERMKTVAKGAPPEAIANLELAMPHNLTIEMGLDLYKLAKLLKDSNVDSDAIDLKDRRLPRQFINEWERFLDLYGHRGPKELDIVSPRYREQPSLLLDQIKTLNRSTDEQNNPVARYEKNRALRNQAYLEVCEFLENTDKRQVRRFKSLYLVWENLGGYRENHKYCLIFALDIVRSKMLELADQLVKKGRLEKREQIFNLTLENIDRDVKKGKANLVDIGRGNRKFSDKLAKVPSLPSLIDSRGRILRPLPPEHVEGAIVGAPISSGVARGRIKVLHTPDENHSSMVRFSSPSD